MARQKPARELHDAAEGDLDRVKELLAQSIELEARTRVRVQFPPSDAVVQMSSSKDGNAEAQGEDAQLFRSNSNVLIKAPSGKFVKDENAELSDEKDVKMFIADPTPLEAGINPATNEGLRDIVVADFSSSAPETEMVAAPNAPAAQAMVDEDDSKFLAQKEKIQDKLDAIRDGLEIVEMAPLISGTANYTRTKKITSQVFGFICECSCEIVNEVRLTLFLVLLLGLVIMAIFLIADLKLHKVDFEDVKLHSRYVGVVVAGVFTFGACLLTFIQVRRHYQNWVHPPSQRNTVRILYMVPIYSLSAFFSLMFIEFSLYIDFIRGIYEAFVLYTFLILLTKYLGGHRGVVETIRHKNALHWPKPFCCFPPCVPNSNFVWHMKFGTLQYAIVQPICSLIALILDFNDMYGDGKFKANKGYAYISMIINYSQCHALYCLAWIYLVLKNELAPFNPITKFLVVKSVVFLTWWQGLCLAIMVKIGWIKESPDMKVGEVAIGEVAICLQDVLIWEVAIGLQDVLICVEMFIAAVVHAYAFSFQQYRDGRMKLLMEQRALYLAQQKLQMEEEERKAKGKKGAEGIVRQTTFQLPGMEDVQVQDAELDALASDGKEAGQVGQEGAPATVSKKSKFFGAFRGNRWLTKLREQAFKELDEDEYIRENKEMAISGKFFATKCYNIFFLIVDLTSRIKDILVFAQGNVLSLRGGGSSFSQKLFKSHAAFAVAITRPKIMIRAYKAYQVQVTCTVCLEEGSSQFPQPLL
eukprot:g9611.t1